MKCPVCPQDNIADDAGCCPNCGTDLSAIRRVERLPTALLNEAIALAQAGATDLALARAAAAAVMDGHCVEAKLLLGRLLWKRGQADDAMHQWQEALALDKNCEEASHLLREARYTARKRAIRRVSARVGVAMVLVGLVVAVCFAIVLSIHNLQTGAEQRLSRIETLQAEHDRKVIESLVPLFQSLRPLNADELTNRLRELTNQHAELESLMAQYEKKWSLLPFRLHDAKRKLTECKRQLELCRAEYEARVVPWEEGMKKLQAAAMSVQGSTSSRPTSMPTSETVPQGQP